MRRTLRLLAIGLVSSLVLVGIGAWLGAKGWSGLGTWIVGVGDKLTMAGPTVLAAICGLVGGLAALCIRLITPGKTFLAPPKELEGKGRLYTIMARLTYASDLILGAVAGVVVWGLSDIASNDAPKLIATAILAGVGGAGLLTNLGTKLQAEQSAAESSVTQLERQNTLISDKAKGIGSELDRTKEVLREAQRTGNLSDVEVVTRKMDEIVAQTNQIVGVTVTPVTGGTAPGDEAPGGGAPGGN